MSSSRLFIVTTRILKKNRKNDVLGLRMVCVHVKIIEWRIYWLSGLLSINKVIELPRVPFSGVVLEATLEDDPPVGVQSVLLLSEAHSSGLSQ